jgi:hypothetical protein
MQTYSGLKNVMIQRHVVRGRAYKLHTRLTNELDKPLA